jgi:hypothetical protein
MVWKSVRVALIVGVCTAAATLAARAGDCGAPAAGCGAPAAECCAPQFRTVCCTEWVPEPYQCTRTCYHTEYRQQTSTTWRCEYTPEQRTRTYTVCKMVPEVRTEWRTVCVSVPCVEQRTVMKAHWTCKPVVHMVTKWEDHGHYECHMVPCKPSCRDRLKKCFHHNDCCEDCCQPMKEVRCWVPCKVCVQCPVTTYQRCCEYVPVTCNVTTCRTELRKEACQVTCCHPVTECRTETCTVMVPHQVAVPCTRTVAVCVPSQETVTLTRLVPHTVQKQVPVTPCGNEAPCCEAQTCGHHKRHCH